MKKVIYPMVRNGVEMQISIFGNVLVTGLFLLMAVLGKSQVVTNVLSHTEFLTIVSQNHPLVYKSNLLNEMALANTLIAKGQFDPLIETYYDQKNYDGKNYYSELSSNVKIPTWFGVDIKAGYDLNRGDFVNNSEILPPRGIWNAGIAANLGNGLMFDYRRAEIRKAEVFENSTEAERVLMLNELIFEANWAYWDWSARYSIYNVAKLGLEIAQDRYEATVSRFENGDIPAIDTLESQISVQNRLIDTLNAFQELEAAKFYLQNFLWQDGYIPLELQDGIVPEDINYTVFSTKMDSIQLLKDEVLRQHPELLLYEYKIDNLEIEDRLNREALKPDVQLVFNPLVGSTNDQLFRSYDVNDYKLGASFVYPLFLRQERGKLKMTRIKIRDTNYDRDLKRQNIFLKLDTYLNNSRMSENQTRQLALNVDQYRQLLEAENQKFRLGESSVFLINSREVQYLDAQVKLTELKLKVIKNALGYLLTSSQLHNQ